MPGIAQSLVRLGRLGHLRRHTSGAAAVEFALILPVFLVLGLYGTEVANMTVANLQVSQIALSVADNASRLGQTDNSGVTPTITEADVDGVLYGALQQGTALGFATRGRVILTSLEKDATTGKQYIHWQRCRGSLARTSAYGNDGLLNGLTSAVITGLGAGTQKVTANTGSAVMFAEVYYQYRGIIGSMYVGTITMKREAAFIIRDDRNLTPGLTGGGSQSACT
jgi:Flp pilus assembly protein TadG